MWFINQNPIFSNTISNVNYNFICLCETWLNTNVFDAEFGFINYNIYRDDRNLSFGKTRCINCHK